MPMTAHLRRDALFNIIQGEQLASPCYVYDLPNLQMRIDALKNLTPNRCRSYFAMKCNHVPDVLKTMVRNGLGVDLVSGGEWQVAHENGFAADDVIFSGVGKTVAEIDEAILLNLGQLNVESLPELNRIIGRAQLLGMSANVSLRLNLGIATNTHPHISTGNLEHKFGLPLSQLPEASRAIAGAKTHIKFLGIAAHVGSQISELETFESVLQLLLKLQNDLKRDGHSLTRIDCGGGWAIDYKNDTDIFPLMAWMKKMGEAVEAYPHLQFQFEPGRWLVAPIGGLLARVEYVKRTPHKNFLIVNTGMHHLLRPALYHAHHRISHAEKSDTSLSRWTAGDQAFTGSEIFDVVGPICESTDVLGQTRHFKNPREGDWILIHDTGAYGEVMASHYNLQAPFHRYLLK